MNTIKRRKRKFDLHLNKTLENSTMTQHEWTEIMRMFIKGIYELKINS